MSNSGSNIITARSATKAGAWLLRVARSMARKLPASGVTAVRYSIIDGFILQAKRIKSLRSGLVVDTPGFILLCGQVQVSETIQIGDTAVQAGWRDDFARSADSYQGQPILARHSDTNNPRYMVQPSAAIDDELSVLSVSMVNQRGSRISIGRFSAPVSGVGGESGSSLDDMAAFTPAHNAGIGGIVAIPNITARPAGFNEDGNLEIAPIPETYFNSLNYVIRESSLVDGWKFHPRRQVVHTAYSPANDPYRVKLAFNVMPSFAISPCDGDQLIGIDQFCLAARVFRQYIGTWYESEPGTIYRPAYYDRHGEQGLLVSVAQYDRSEFLEGDGIVHPQLIDQYRIAPSDIPMDELHPLPVLLPANLYGRPARPNYGQFLTPCSVITSAGFVTFCAYSTLRDDTATGPSGAYGMACAIVTVLPDHSCVVLRADWDAGDDTALIPTAVPGQFVQSWIVGVERIDSKSDDTVSVSGYCLSWEQSFIRKPTAALSRGIGGQWALYATDGVSVTRTILAGGGAPLFAPGMSASPKDDHYDQSVGEPFSSLCKIGPSQMATAAIATPHAVPVGNDIADHDIQCAVINVADGTIQFRGVIARRSKTYRKCFISCVQMAIPADDSPERPAVLLATVTDHLVGNGGKNGKVYISVDGGNNWAEYISDIGGQCGALYVGNKMWAFSNALPLTIGDSNEAPT